METNSSKIKDKSEILVVAIGDSITYGYPYSRKESWVRIASDRLGISIFNSGQPGDLTADLRSRFQKDVLSFNPTHVIIMGGTNDAFYNIPEATVRNNIYQMTEMAKAAGIKPTIGIPIPVDDTISEQRLSLYRKWMREFAQGQGFPVLDFYKVMVDQESGYLKQGLYDDGVHPNLEGYQGMAEIVEIK
ncbi:MAG: SGNH/GDSL hydrolase family protein [Thermincolia bacterium]